MKIIELLNKIANEEELPPKIRYCDITYNYANDVKDYQDREDYLFSNLFNHVIDFLNDEVEIIEEEKKIPEEITVSEEQMLFNNLTTIDQEYVIRFMKMLQPPIDYLNSKGE